MANKKVSEFPDMVSLTGAEKLTGLQAGANKNAPSSLLLNRANHTGVQAATSITQTGSYRFVTDAEKAAWNASAPALATPITFTEDVPTDKLNSTASYDMADGAITLTPDLALSTDGGGATYSILADGVTAPVVAADFVNIGSNTFDNTAGTTNIFVFSRLASGAYVYSIIWIGVIAVLDIIPPTLDEIVVEDAAPASVDFTFDETLDPTHVPLASDFTVSGHTTTGTVSISGNVARVVVTAPFVNGEAARTGSYTPGLTANKLRDTAGNLVVAFSSEPITNNVLPADAIPPDFVSATVENATPTIVDVLFDEALAAGHVPLASDFTVSGHTTTGTVTLTGSTAHVPVTVAFVSGEVATVAYTPGLTANKLQDATGNLVVAFSGETIDNNVGYVPVDFTGSTGIIPGAAPNDWIGLSTAAAYGNLGIATAKMPAGGDSRVIFEYNGTTSFAANLGLHSSNVEIANTSMLMGMSLYAPPATAQLNKITSGTTSTVTNVLSAGDWFCLHRDVAGTITLEQSVNSGTSWTVMFTFVPTSTADLWIVADVYGEASGIPATLVNVLGENLV